MKVELLSVFGDDNMVADCARVSYQKESSSYSGDQNVKLINYLAKHNHWSPFSHPKLQFRLEMPIYVERQLIKTQAGVEYNSISGRYVDFSDTYTLIPHGGWRSQSKDSKQGSDGLVDTLTQITASKIQKEVNEVGRKAYQDLVNMGISKEQARTVLGLNLNTTQIWTGSLYSFIRLCNQRLKPDAQQETRELVQEMLNQVLGYGHNPFEHSLKAFGYE